ncbi:MAG: L,D-transpeptidase [Sandaracinaceae bacterium]
MALAFSVGCGGEDETPDAGPPDAASEAPSDPGDAGVDAGHDAGPPRPPARIFARRYVSKIRDRPDREAFRIGYLRAGAIMQATTGEPVRTDDPRCRGGWYELTTGGFVCNGRDVIAFWGRRLPAVQGAQPDRSAPLPYRYGRTRGNDIPMYRRPPTDEEAAQYEGFRIPGLTPEPGEEGAEGGSSEAGDAASEAVTPTATAGSAPGVTAASASAASGSPEGGGDDDPAEEAEEEPITLASLAGDRNSVLITRMVSGWIVSLDRDFRAGQYRRRYWRTVNNGFIPYRAVGDVSWPDFRGVPLGDLTQLPVGYVMGSNEAFFVRTADGRARRGGAAESRTRLTIVGEETIGGTPYYVGANGRLYREQDVRRIGPARRPRQVGEHDKWIEVNLSEQYVVAYEGDTPVYVTLTSTGRAYHPDDPDSNFLTPTGTYRIRAKHLAATMDGDTAADGPYSIHDVPYVMYFQLAYALHGAFWHRAFGYPRSHGCVNLAPRDAQWIFNWSDPYVPQGWHGAYPTEDHPGTWVWIHGETPGSGSR